VANIQIFFIKSQKYINLISLKMIYKSKAKITQWKDYLTTWDKHLYYKYPKEYLQNLKDKIQVDQ
jgi:hypothetical protein